MLFPNEPTAGRATTRLALADATATAELPAVTWLGVTDEETARGWDRSEERRVGKECSSQV